MDDPQWAEIIDPETGETYHLRFHSKNRLAGIACEDCGFVGGIYVGETADGTERFTMCNRCENGYRYLPKKDIC